MFLNLGILIYGSFHDPYFLLSLNSSFHKLTFGIKFIICSIENSGSTPWENIISNLVLQNNIKIYKI